MILPSTSISKKRFHSIEGGKIVTSTEKDMALSRGCLGWGTGATPLENV